MSRVHCSVSNNQISNNNGDFFFCFHWKPHFDISQRYCRLHLQPPLEFRLTKLTLKCQVISVHWPKDTQWHCSIFILSSLISKLLSFTARLSKICITIVERKKKMESFLCEQFKCQCGCLIVLQKCCLSETFEIT